MAIEYVADFETTSVRVYDDRGKLDPVRSEAWVCAWAIIPVEAEPDPVHIIRGRDIESFMECVAYIYLALPQTGKKQKRPKLNVFTHNLKFDGDFIMTWLLHGNGEITQETREQVLYNFTAVWEDGEVEVTFRDSLKIFPQAAWKIGELYGIPKLKGEWDYNKFRWPDERTPISSEEWDYVDHDVMIISRALADYRSQGYVENTQAAIAYNDRLRMTYPKFRKTIAQYLKKKDYERYLNSFPKDIRPLPYELHKHLMTGYFGGISYLNPRYANLPLEYVYSYDVHSMYPDKMANGWLPVGSPMIIDNPTQEEAWRMIRTYHCVMVDIEHLTVKLKSEDHFPSLMFATDDKTSVRMEGKILKCQDEMICLTGIDCQIMESEYDIESCVVTRIYLFKSVKGQYKKFVDHWMGIKSDADRIKDDPAATPEEKAAAKTRRALAKVMMNSSYGKDGTKLLRYPHKTYLDPETGVLALDIDVEVADIEYYIPSAIFICALARQQLWNAVRLLRKEFIYCDTDSVKVTAAGKKILESSPDFIIDDYKLGTWGYEGEYRTAKFVRQKTYSYEQLNKKGCLERHYVVCGAPDDIKAVMDIDEFAPGMAITVDKIHKCKDPETGKPLQGRLIPVRVRGGVILEEGPFHISKIDNWDEKSGRNMPIDFARLCAIIK